MRVLFLLITCLLTFANAKAQVPAVKKNNSDSAKVDTLAAAKYINKGQIAGKKAIRRSLIFPGLGQIYNYGLVVNDVKSGYYGDKRVLQKIYIIGKIGLIYGGGAVLVSSYIENNRMYKASLAELVYRQENDDANRDPQFTRYETAYLTTAKDIAKNNREIVLLSMFALYGANIIDAYVTARLKYHNVENELSYKITPTLINSSTMYGFSAVPGLKLTLKL